MRNMKHLVSRLRRASFIVGLLSIAPSVFAANGCVGTVAKVWMESSDVLYFNLTPKTPGSCGCNRDEVPAGDKGFEVAANKANKEDQYSALLAAAFSGKPVGIWYDWQSSQGEVRCVSHSVAAGHNYD